jgi:glycosyltransferase involved in cell wall biosynthesis
MVDKSMHIVIDARELCGRPTGVGRYLSGLLDAWSRSDAFRRHEFTLIAPTEPEHGDRWKARLKIVRGSGGTLWEQATLPSATRAERADVFFAPGYTAPLTVTAPLVLTIHDVSFFAHPEWFSFREGARRRFLTKWSARRARAVITDTNFSRSEIADHIGVPPSRINVISLGLSTPQYQSAVAVPREPMVLFVGSIFERRRVDRLIAAFDAVVARVPAATLQIVGENRTRQPRLDLEALRRRTSHPDRIHIRSYVDDSTLANLYRAASVFAFLSEYEGFGFTPLEALREGVPPVLLDTPVARETCGNAARYVDHHATTDQVAAAIAELMTNAESRATLLQDAEAVLSRYDWDRAGAETLTVLEEAAGGR